MRPEKPSRSRLLGLEPPELLELETSRVVLARQLYQLMPMQVVPVRWAQWLMTNLTGRRQALVPLVQSEPVPPSQTVLLVEPAVVWKLAPQVLRPNLPGCSSRLRRQSGSTLTLMNWLLVQLQVRQVRVPGCLVVSLPTSRLLPVVRVQAVFVELVEELAPEALQSVLIAPGVLAEIEQAAHAALVHLTRGRK